MLSCFNFKVRVVMLMQHHPILILSYHNQIHITNTDFLIIDIAVADPRFSRGGRQPQRWVLTYYLAKFSPKTAWKWRNFGSANPFLSKCWSLLPFWNEAVTCTAVLILTKCTFQWFQGSNELVKPVKLVSWSSVNSS